MQSDNYPSNSPAAARFPVSGNVAQHATMTSREIAELVNSRQDSVRRTIERLAERGVIALPPLVEKSTAGRPAVEYVFSGEQGKRGAADDREAAPALNGVAPQAFGSLLRHRPCELYGSP